MADNTIDTLDIQINSNTRNAAKSLGNLAKKLKDVDSALGKVNTGGLRNYAREIGRVSAALQSLNKTKVSVPDLTGLTGQLRSLAKVDFTSLGASTKSLQNLAAGLNSLKGASGISIPKIDTKNVKSAVNAIQKFQEIDAAKMQPAITGVQRIAGIMNTLNGMDFKDSKITNVINSVRRLTEVDMSGFDTSKMGEIIKNIDSLNNVEDVSSGVNRLVGSLAKLSNAGEKIGQSASGLNLLGKELKKVVNMMAGTRTVSESTNMFVQSIGRLASAGNKTSQTASQLVNLATEVKKFFTAMQDAPQISENTLRMTEALGQLAAAGGKVGTATNTVVNSFNKLSSIGSGLSSLLGTVATKAKSGIGFLATGISSLINRSSGLKTASSNVGSFIKTVLGFKAASAVMSKFSEAMGGKGILEIGSDIAEVENVVDVAFGSMADQAYKFASTATKQFGLSELAAKNYSGTMMAMLNASGVAQESAAKMSTTLAGLAGDLASFYNIDTDTAFYKLRAGISGEIEPLKQLGINLSVANLQEYALSQGITTAYNSMTQAQKTMLRYNYIMSVTSAQQGDFARTAGSYANQVRLLTLNIQSLASVIGQGLIAAVLPGIQALNALMSKLMQAAETFRDFMYVLMGKKVKGSTSGVVNDLAGLEDSAADLSGLQDAGDAAASGMDDATSSAKALKKALSVLPFDELNQLTDNSNSSGSTPGTGTGNTGTGTTPALGLGGITDQIDDALNKEETPINKWAEKIRKAFLNHDWEGLGKTIADMLNLGIRKIYDVINWSNVGPKISAFCDAFTRTLNSLVDNIDWDLMGRTVGAGINTLVNTFELLIGPGGIDFTNIGNKLAVGLRGMLDEVNWPNLGKVLGSGFMISWNILDGFVQRMSKENNAGLTGWEQLGTAVSDAMNGAFSRISFPKIANTIATGLNGAFQTLAAWTKNFKWDELVNNISGGINTFVEKFKWKENGKSLNTFITNLLDALVDIAEKTDWEAFGEGIGTFLSQIDWGAHLKKLATVLLDVLGGIWKGLGSTSAGKFVDAVVFGIVSFKAFNKISPFIDGLVKFCTGSTVEDKLSKGMQKLLGKTVESAAENSGSLFGSLAGKAGTLATKLGSLATAIAPLVGTAGLIVGIGAAAAAGVKGLQSLIEKMQGGNGIATEYGNAINAFIAQLSSSGAITEDEANKLFKLSESMESSGTSASDAYAKIAEKLGTYGVTSDQAQQALSRLSQQQSITSGSLTGLQTAMDGLGNSVSNTSYKIDASKLSYDGLYDATKAMWTQLGLTRDQYTALDTVILNGESTKATAKQTYDNLIATLKDMGVNTQTAAKIIGQVMPDALVQASNTANSSGNSMKNSISNNTKNAADNANRNLDSIKSTANSVLPSVATAASTAFGKVNTEATTKWGNSSREVTKNVRQMKIDAGTELARMDNTVRSHFGSQYNIALGKWKNLGRDVSSYIRGSMNTSVANGINTITNTISRNFGNMYSIGQNAMQNLRNGMESINIRTPHISMDYTDWQEGNTHKWQYNSRVSWYAKGGLFNAASVIGVGEAGKEAVLPLTNKQAMKNIADSITGNMPEGSVGLSKEEMTQAVTQGVAMAMMNMNAGGNTSPQYISNTINLDGRAIAKAVTKAQNDNNRRKNPSPAW